MRAGDLSTRMEIQERTLSLDAATGQQAAGWAPAGRIWLGRKYKSGAETFASGVEKQSQALEFWAHYSSARRVTPKHRLVDAQGARYDVLSVDLGGRSGLSVITTQTGLNDG